MPEPLQPAASEVSRHNSSCILVGLPLIAPGIHVHLTCIHTYVDCHCLLLFWHMSRGVNILITFLFLLNDEIAHSYSLPWIYIFFTHHNLEGLFYIEEVFN